MYNDFRRSGVPLALTFATSAGSFVQGGAETDSGSCVLEEGVMLLCTTASTALSSSPAKKGGVRGRDALFALLEASLTKGFCAARRGSRRPHCGAGWSKSLCSVTSFQAISKFDMVVVGAGIVGLATARELLLRHAGLRIAVLDKEQVAGFHQTGHNSGVVHAGIYYPPGSLKAKLCVEGLELSYRWVTALVPAT